LSRIRIFKFHGNASALLLNVLGSRSFGRVRVLKSIDGNALVLMMRWLEVIPQAHHQSFSFAREGWFAHKKLLVLIARRKRIFCLAAAAAVAAAVRRVHEKEKAAAVLFGVLSYVMHA